MAYVALFLTACVASQISFMACVALKLVFAAFCTKVRFQGVCRFSSCFSRYVSSSNNLVFLAYPVFKSVFVACVGLPVSSLVIFSFFMFAPCRRSPSYAGLIFKVWPF